MSGTSILSRPVEMARIPATSLDVEFVADAKERAALAAAYDLVEVTALSASASLDRGGKGSVLVRGRVVASIVHTCVVSLVAVDQHIDESFSVRFIGPASPDRPPPPKPPAAVVIDADQPDPPEILTGPSIDLGALVEERFVLAIDPYPRAADAVVPADAVLRRETVRDSPFAALAVLAKNRSAKG